MAATLQNTLADSARADGLHDFGPIGPTKTADRTDAFDRSVIGQSFNNWTNEDLVLNAIFNNTNVRGLLDSLTDGATAGPYTTITGHDYRIKRVVFMGPGAGKGGAQLASEIKLDGSVLQVDFNHHGFLSRLKTGPAAPEVNVGYIWSAATVNDPASKTPPQDGIFKPGGEGVTLTAYEQTSGVTPFPGSQPYDKAAPTKNFVSTYDLELSGIIKKVSFGRRVKDIVTLKFTDPPTKRTVLISDSKGQNSPAQLNGFITKLLASLGSEKAKFELSTKWQQKRSGDWLQVLHAALLSTMTFTPALPGGYHTFFVSHDRIAIGYALAMGISCLYFKDDSIVVFDSRPENPDAARERCIAGLATFTPQQQGQLVGWFFGQDTQRGHTAGLNDIRNQTLAQLATAVTTNCSALTGSLPLDRLEASVKDALKAALRYTFLEKSFPDEATLRAGVQSADPCAQYKFFATVDSLFRQHEGEIAIPQSFFGQFERTMVFKTLSDWRIEPSSSIPSRLMSFVRQQGETPDSRDSFAFFPFIQNSGSSVLKETIARAFRSVLDRLKDPAYLDTLGRMTASRKARVLVGLTNILEQGLLYLKTVAVPDTQVAADAAEFVAYMATPGVVADAEGAGVVNRITLSEVVAAKLSTQSIPDSSPEEAGEMVGGWRAGSRLIEGTEIDFDQCADPLLYAMIEYFMVLGPADARASAAQISGLVTSRDPTQGRGGTRRSLYGGGVITQTMTQTAPSTPTDSRPADIIQICGLLTAGRLARDSWKLVGAPMDVIAYYAKVTSLLSALLAAEATWPLARAMYDLTSHCTYMTDEDFATAFSINAATEDPRVYRLQFSAMEDHLPLQVPAEPAKHLLAAQATLSAIWASLPPNSGDTPDSIRATAEGLMRTIGGRYGRSAPVFPGVGVPLQPGTVVLRDAAAVRQARVAAFGT
jgi:hypothetical protein